MSFKQVEKNILYRAMTLLQYGNVVNDTLEDLADHFDILADDGFLGDDFDCSLAVFILYCF